jgi:hypothetical protein
MDPTPAVIFDVIVELIGRDDVRSVSCPFDDPAIWRALVARQVERARATGLPLQEAFALCGPDSGLNQVPFRDWGGKIHIPYEGACGGDLFILPSWHRFCYKRSATRSMDDSKTTLVVLGLKCCARALLCISVLAASTAALGGDAPPITRDGLLARRAGNYLAANELVNEFSRSKCASLAPSQLQTFDKLAAEMLPAFSPKGREEMREALPGLRQHVAQQARTMVATVIESATKDDKANACAKSLAVVSKVIGEASGAWAATRK